MAGAAVRRWLTQKKVAEVLIIAWIMILLLAAVVPVFPQKSDSPYPDQVVFPAPCIQKDILVPDACSVPSGIPHIFVTFSPTFSAEDGVFAATNPIHISATLQVNRSDFMQYYRGVGFFDAEYLNGTSQGVQLLISRVNNHTYQISGTLVWATAAPVYWFLVPQNQYFTPFLLGPHSNTTAVMLNVTGAENTVAMKASEVTIRWDWGGFGFGVVGLFQMVNVLLPIVRKRRPKKSTHKG